MYLACVYGIRVLSVCKVTKKKPISTKHNTQLDIIRHPKSTEHSLPL